MDAAKDKNVEQPKPEKPRPTVESDEESSTSDDENDEDARMAALFARMSLDGPRGKPTKVLASPTIEEVVAGIKSVKNIIVMTGAGISTSAGIPDFRSPGTGLYHNLQKYNLPTPEHIFHIEYLKTNPNAFFSLAKELFPGQYQATPCHYFIKLLHDKGLLLRNFTQNIDTLEIVAGIPEEKLVFAHGSFSTSHCIGCHKAYDTEWVKKEIFDSKVPKCSVCNGIVKPDIVFFGESLPQRFFELMYSDFPKCDLLFVIGTSLKVQPFASLIDRVSESCPRVLINMEKVGTAHPSLVKIGLPAKGFIFGEYAYRDVFLQGDCDTKCKELAEMLGWADDLAKLIEAGAGTKKGFSLASNETAATPQSAAPTSADAAAADSDTIPVTANPSPGEPSK